MYRRLTNRSLLQTLSASLLGGLLLAACATPPQHVPMEAGQSRQALLAGPAIEGDDLPDMTAWLERNNEEEERQFLVLQQMGLADEATRMQGRLRAHNALDDASVRGGNTVQRLRVRHALLTNASYRLVSGGLTVARLDQLHRNGIDVSASLVREATMDTALEDAVWFAEVPALVRITLVTQLPQSGEVRIEFAVDPRSPTPVPWRHITVGRVGGASFPENATCLLALSPTDSRFRQGLDLPQRTDEPALTHLPWCRGADGYKSLDHYSQHPAVSEDDLLGWLRARAALASADG